MILPEKTIIAGKYQIIKKVKERAFGITYIATDLETNKKLTIKIAYLLLFNYDRGKINI